MKRLLMGYWGWCFPWYPIKISGLPSILARSIYCTFVLAIILNEADELLKSLISLQLMFGILGLAALNFNRNTRKPRVVILIGILIFPWIVLVLGELNFVSRLGVSLQASEGNLKNLFFHSDFLLPLFLWPVVIYSAIKYGDKQNG